VDDYGQRLEQKLQFSAARRTMQRAAALLLGWELIRTEIVDKVRDFFTFGFDASGLIVDPSYEKRVLSHGPRVFDSSVEWLVEAGGLSAQQAEGLKELRDYRNSVAHELGAFLVDPDREVDLSKLDAMREVVGTLGRFWGQIEVDINPDFDGSEVDPQEISSGYMMLFDFVLSALVEEKPA
jgi:hypothetical protein